MSPWLLLDTCSTRPSLDLGQALPPPSSQGTLPMEATAAGAAPQLPPKAGPCDVGVQWLVGTETVRAQQRGSCIIRDTAIPPCCPLVHKHPVLWAASPLPHWTAGSAWMTVQGLTPATGPRHEKPQRAVSQTCLRLAQSHPALWQPQASLFRLSWVLEGVGDGAATSLGIVQEQVLAPQAWAAWSWSQDRQRGGFVLSWARPPEDARVLPGSPALTAGQVSPKNAHPPLGGQRAVPRPVGPNPHLNLAVTRGRRGLALTSGCRGRVGCPTTCARAASSGVSAAPGCCARPRGHRASRRPPPPRPVPPGLLMARAPGRPRAADEPQPRCRRPEPPTTGPRARAASSGVGCSRRRRPAAPA